MLPKTELIKQKCANCKTVIEFSYSNIINEIKWYYLDSRPQNELFTKFNEISVNKCPNCGYCFENIEELTSNFSRVINYSEYKDQIHNELFPLEANMLLCNSLILEYDNQFEKAAFASLHAAWICDDSSKKDEAETCRLRAIDLFNLNNAVLKKINDYSLGDRLKFVMNEYDEYIALILVDLYRRTKQFRMAKRLCDAYLRFSDHILLDFQYCLITNSDCDSYTVNEAIQYFKEEQVRKERFKKHAPFANDNENYVDDTDYYKESFYAMTDGQYGDYDDFIDEGGNFDDIDDWVGK